MSCSFFRKNHPSCDARFIGFFKIKYYNFYKQHSQNKQKKIFILIFIENQDYFAKKYENTSEILENIKCKHLQ